MGLSSGLLTVRTVALSLVVALLLAAAGTGLWVRHQLAPASPGSQESHVVAIPPGAATATVAAELASAGVIRNAWIFRLWTRYQGLDLRIRAGEYRVSPGESVPQLVDRFVRGDVIRYQVTIPEGWRVGQIVNRLAQLDFVDGERLQELTRERHWVEEWLVHHAAIREPLEGYLAPETYSLTREMSEEAIIRMLVRRTEETFSEAWLARADALGLSIHEVLTLASIVEAETRVPGERVTIAGVFWNRLNAPMRLDADPTVHYAVEVFGQPLTQSHLETDSPFNTYRTDGLPPGPIGAPGRASIQAVLFPEEHDYYYFVLKDEASGEHAFARTLNEHNQNIAQYRNR